MMYMLLCILILFAIILIVELLMTVLKIKTTRLYRILSYGVMAMLAFIINQFIAPDYKSFTKVLSISFLAVAFVYLFKKNEDK
ncbi:hypothetical protein [Metasolibacillus sp. FSL K6-0083]|uniref:hypothetical protein n=1 Tax=Metasolibacillus sp. FSL K6-0083 TaxID=2921416 RepID=UPI003159F9E3